MADRRPEEQEAIVEAVLFAMGRSVETEELAAALECSTKEAAEAAARLKERYEKENRGMNLLKLESRWQLGTKKEYYDALIRVAKAPKKQVLSQVVLETLSIIAYRQPVTKSEISRIRGVSSDHAVNKLIEYGLVYEAGRLDAPGRPAQFATTEEFLRRFGVDSKADLPEVTPDQEAEIADEVQKEMNYRFGTEAGALGPEEQKAPEGETGEQKAPEEPAENQAPEGAAEEPAGNQAAPEGAAENQEEQA